MPGIPLPSAARVDEIESSALCDRCKERAHWVVRYRAVCEGGAAATEPLDYLMCGPCLHYFGEVIKHKNVVCMSCEKPMSSLTHGIREVEKL